MNTFERAREATIQFNDVFGVLPVAAAGSTEPLVDFDAELTAQVRNTGSFRDAQYPIGTWPALGDYGVVLLEQLRQEQQLKAAGLGLDVEALDSQLHPDYLALCQSLSGALIAIVNKAPRTNGQSHNGRNGEEFYVGITQAGNEVYGQLPHFRGLKARGWLSQLSRIPNDAGVWQPGEQFRSSYVSALRPTPEILEQVDASEVPKIEQDIRLAYVDTFGNVRLEVANLDSALDHLKRQEVIRLQVGDGGTVEAHAVERLTDIPRGDLGIYGNPSERNAADGAGYLELVRRVNEPNGHSQHAYHSLVSQVSRQPEGLAVSCWEGINLTFVDS